MRHVFLVAILLVTAGCWTSSREEVVVYCALDREFSEPILDDFEARTGIKVLAKYDVESTKTVGLVNAIIQERQRPRCDVFWNNEILHTLRLEKMDLLQAYRSPGAESWPEEYRSPGDHWIGLAARARVLIVNSKLVPESEQPDSIEDLIDPKWKGKVAVAKPLFGTTATHAAVLFAAWPEDRAKQFFTALKDNAAILSGNKQVAESVARGDYAFGLTDTDDAVIEQDKQHPVRIVFPDQDDLGTLFIPNSISIIRGSRNQEAAKKLIDFLLQPEIEERLAKGASAQFPINPRVEVKPRVATDDVKRMPVDFAAASDAWQHAAEYLRDLFASDE